MSGGEYAPKDSRDVTARPDPDAEFAPGVPTGWHDRGPDGDAPEDKMAPDDSRNVTGAKPAGAAPGEASGWRDVEGQGKQDADAATGIATASVTAPGAEQPPIVPQADKPFTAEDAAAAARRREG